MEKVVFDASALLAFLFNEPGMERVREVLPHGVMSAVNHAEVIAIALRRGGKLPETTALLAQLPIETVSFSTDDAILAASLWPSTKEKGLSLGDRCCLALGIKLGLRVLTADRQWSNLPINVHIETIR